MWLPIEDHPDLFSAFGLAIAWISAVENRLAHVIKLRSTSCDFCLERIDGLTFGALIDRAQNFIEPETLTRLKELNSSRIMLLHGSHSEVATLASASTLARTGRFVVTHKGETTKLSKQSLEQIAKECREVSELLS